ncbi:MAG: inositol monophosphatase [Planctomycetaceae bacterium]|nr:inositol monophosphatase [Planctomycetaceae bacterium]
MQPSYLKICEYAARAAGAVLKEKVGKIGFREKGQADLVTEADTQAQETIRKIVGKAFPDHEFLGEETPGASADSYRNNPDSFCWVVDPLDGTTNFVHQVPFFCTSIALARGNELLCGVVYNPVTEEFFSAEQGKGAFLNGVRLCVSNVKKPEDSLVAVGFPPNTQLDCEDLQAFLKAVPIAQAIRRSGSTALNLAYVAAGRFDAMWGYSTNAWDIAAGALLLQEAGGVIVSTNGGPIALEDPKFLCAANETLLNAWAEILS